MISGFNHINLGSITLTASEDSTWEKFIFEKFFTEQLDKQIFYNYKPAIIEMDLNLEGYVQVKSTIICSNLDGGYGANIILNRDNQVSIMIFELTFQRITITILPYNGG